MANKISAKIVADSVSPQGHRITSYILTYPRFIHAELMTHRMFSRNSASSRAIPFKKMLHSVLDDPFIPIAWQKDHSGMQGTEYFTDPEMIEILKQQWIEGSKEVVLRAKILNESKLTKQLCNRLLEPFLWHTVLVTATEWDNFFELRCPQYEISGYPANRSAEATEPSIATFKSKKEAIKWLPELKELTWFEWQGANDSQAEIHIQALAEAMWDAMKENTPKQLKEGEWHIPFGDKMAVNLETLRQNFIYPNPNNQDVIDEEIQKLKIKIATARCARLSYMTFDGAIDYEKDIKLHDQLLESGHMSPFEHCAEVMSEEIYSSFIKGYCEMNWTDRVSDDFITIEGGCNINNLGWCNNFRGFIPYRYLIENGD